MEDLETEYRKIKDYDFDFENLAFEGGGVKMASYIGVVKVGFQKKKREKKISCGILLEIDRHLFVILLIRFNQSNYM